MNVNKKKKKTHYKSRDARFLNRHIILLPAYVSWIVNGVVNGEARGFHSFKKFKTRMQESKVIQLKLDYQST